MEVDREDVIEVLKRIVDPELFIDVWTLGLIYDIELNDDLLNIRMTFTSVACPVGPELVQEVIDKTKEIPGIRDTNVTVVFSPPWQPSEELKALLGIG